MSMLQRVIMVVPMLVLASLAAQAGGNRPPVQPYEAATVAGEPSFCVLAKPGDVTKNQEGGWASVVTHIIGQQCDNGGFGWEHADCSATYQNLTGPILLGVLDNYARFSHDIDHLFANLDGGIFALTSVYPNGEARFATFNPLFLQELAAVTGNTSFTDYVTTRLFDELEAGTYGPNDRDTAGWILEIQTVRTGTWVNLRPWEFSTLVPTSEALGNPGQSDLFTQAILDGLDTLDNTDPDNVYSDILGVAGAVRGLAYAQLLTFGDPVNAPLHAGVDGIDNLEDLAAYLASLQNPDGSWYWHSNLATPGEDDKDVQTTAYAVLALVQVDRLVTADYQAAAEVARDWIVSLQQPDGGILSYPGGDENTEVEGEALSAMLAVEPLIFYDDLESGGTSFWSDQVP